jgi:hypothetical protein
MLRRARRSFVYSMPGLLLALFTFCNGMSVLAQGWTSRVENPAVTPAASKGKSEKTAKKTSAVKGNPVKANPATKKSVAAKQSNAVHEQGTAPAHSAVSRTAKSKGSRERRVSAPDTGATKTPAVPVTESATAAPKTGRCDPDKDERLDLSGTYSGSINYPAAGMLGDATLTISGNRFSLNAGSKSETGNITAVATCKYTAVAMMFGQWRTPQPGDPVQPPLPMLSLTATRQGDQLVLKTSPSERREFSFAPKTGK